MTVLQRYWPAAAAMAVLGGGCLATDQEGEPFEPVETVRFRTVAAGSYHACGLTFLNEAYCWGENSIGQLGNGDFGTSYFPVSVVQGGVQFQEISPGASLTCAVTGDGAAYCWGGNDVGQIGIGIISLNAEPAPDRVGGGHDFSAVSAGGVHACALTQDRVALCWGATDGGRLGNGGVGLEARPNPDSVLGGHLFDLLSAGVDHTCALTGAGEAYCWGVGREGQLGNGDTQNAAEPVLVAGEIQFMVVDAGANHTCGLDLDGRAYCWGEGIDGQLGTGDPQGSSVPVAVTGDLTFQSISAGGAVTCGVATGGEAYCWGRNEVGQLGDGTFENRFEPTAVVGGLLFDEVSVGTGVGGTAVCGYASDGYVYCWGEGQLGQVGNGDGLTVNVPTLVVGQGG